VTGARYWALYDHGRYPGTALTRARWRHLWKDTRHNFILLESAFRVSVITVSVTVCSNDFLISLSDSSFSLRGIVIIFSLWIVCLFEGDIKIKATLVYDEMRLTLSTQAYKIALLCTGIGSHHVNREFTVEISSFSDRLPFFMISPQPFKRHAQGAPDIFMLSDIFSYYKFLIFALSGELYACTLWVRNPQAEPLRVCVSILYLDRNPQYHSPWKAKTRYLSKTILYHSGSKYSDTSWYPFSSTLSAIMCVFYEDLIILNYTQDCQVFVPVCLLLKDT
jgi:hypothetical protein